MNSAQELLVRERLVEMISEVPQIGRVIPSPLKFADASEYWSTNEDENFNTLEHIDGATIFFSSLYFRSWRDLDDGDENAPTIEFYYGLYLFAQSNYERVNELATEPHLYKMMLKNYNRFVAVSMDLKEQFQGRLPIPGLDSEIFTTKYTLPLEVLEEAQNNVDCRFVPGITGYSVTFGLTAQIRLRDC